MTIEHLSITLPSDISYVYGTVNGVAATFSLSSPNVWTAVVDKAEDGKYEVSITAYNSLGTQTTINKTIYSHVGWLAPKLDWTQDDYYNFEDLNRVENNTIYVAELIAEFGLMPAVDVDVSRDISSIEFADSLNRIEGNQDLLRQRYTPVGWINNKFDWQKNDPFDFNDAARLEINLSLLHFYYQGNLDARPYCGLVTCGEDLI